MPCLVLVEILEKITTNLEQPKYRRLNKSSKAFGAAVWKQPSCNALLLALGFVETKVCG